MRTTSWVSNALLFAVFASSIACGGSSGSDNGLDTLPDDHHDDGSQNQGTGPGAPTPPGETPTPPAVFTVGDAVEIAPSPFLPRGITTSGDVLLSRDDPNSKVSYHVAPLKGGGPTSIEDNLSAQDSEGSVLGEVVEIRKAPPSSTTGQMDIWSRAGGLKPLGTVVRHYDAFASSADGKRIAYVTSKGELKTGPFGAATNVATGIDVQREECTPHVEYVGDLLVTSTCKAGGGAGGDLRTWDATGAMKQLAGGGSVGYNSFSFAGTTTHVVYDSGAIGSPLSIVQLASGTKTTIDKGSASQAALSTDGSLAVFRSSSRDELRVWKNGQSSILVDRGSVFRVSPDRKWVVSTRTYPSPAKLLLVEVASGAQTEIADNAYSAGFSGDGKRFFYRVNNGANLQMYDIATKASVDIGPAASFTAIPGRPEGFTLECPAGSDYDALVCSLSLYDTETKTKKVLDPKTSHRIEVQKNAIVYVRDGGSVVARPISY